MNTANFKVIDLNVFPSDILVDSEAVYHKTSMTRKTFTNEEPEDGVCLPDALI